MDFSTFYCLKTTDKRGTLCAKTDTRYDVTYKASAPLDCQHIVQADALLRGEIYPDTPVMYRRLSGKNAYDFVYTSSLSVRLISRRVEDLLRVNGFTGWTTFPARLFGVRHIELEGYSGLSITGRCGPIDPRKGALRAWPTNHLKNKHANEATLSCYDRPTTPFSTLVGTYFDENTWDGSDLFLPGDWSSVFITQQVRDAFTNANMVHPVLPYV
jgi:hypothetical protein